MIRNSIRNKLLILLLAATILPITTSIAISYHYTKNSVTKKSVDENSNLILLGKMNILNYINNINQLSLSVYNGIDRPSTLYTLLEHTRNPAEEKSDTTDYVSSRDSIYLHLFNMFQSNKDFFQIHFYVLQAQQSNLMVSNLFRRQPHPDYTLPRAEDDTYKPFIEPTHPLHPYGMNFTLPNAKAAPSHVLTLHRPIFRQPTDELLAFLSMDIKLDELKVICSQLFDPAAEKLYILDAKKGAVIYSPDQQDYGTTISEPWFEKVSSSAENGHFAWNDSHFSGIVFFDKMKTAYMDWIVVKQVPYEYLYQDAKKITQINSFIVALFLIMAAIGTIFISFHFTTPIKNLIAYVNKVQTGSLDVDPDVRSHDEIGLLSRKIQSMMQTINNLILREYRLEITNKTNQLKALQAQVNPHFLYNALQSIATLALHYKAPKIYSLITSLGKMMRYNMNTDETEVSLQREMEHVKSYLELQKERFGDQLALRVEIEEEAMGIVVPKMILQPIVENYFKHGFDSGAPVSELDLSCKMGSGRRLLISVEDTGKGMEEGSLTELREQLQSAQINEPKPFASIGLYNVLIRLKLYFGNGVELRITNRKPHGLAVTLEIPLKKGGGEAI